MPDDKELEKKLQAAQKAKEDAKPVEDAGKNAVVKGAYKAKHGKNSQN